MTVAETYTTAEIAAVAHELNRKLQELIGEEVSPAWPFAPEWQRASAIEGVEKHLAGLVASPEASHESWLEHKERTGWRYGPVKDEQAKTHPLMVPYAELHPMQKLKDRLFSAVVAELGGSNK